MNDTNFIAEFNKLLPVGSTCWELDLLPGTGQNVLAIITQPASINDNGECVFAFRRDGDMQQITVRPTPQMANVIISTKKHNL